MGSLGILLRLSHRNCHAAFGTAAERTDFCTHREGGARPMFVAGVIGVVARLLQHVLQCRDDVRALLGIGNADESLARPRLARTPQRHVKVERAIDGDLQ